MPGGDRTGPMGMGQMTGRGAGYCAGYPARQPTTPPTLQPVQPVPPAQPQQAYPQYTREQEIADLRAERELIERDLKAIAERIKELENKK